MPEISLIEALRQVLGNVKYNTDEQEPDKPYQRVNDMPEDDLEELIDETIEIASSTSNFEQNEPSPQTIEVISKILTNQRTAESNWDHFVSTYKTTNTEDLFKDKSELHYSLNEKESQAADKELARRILTKPELLERFTRSNHASKQLKEKDALKPKEHGTENLIDENALVYSSGGAIFVVRKNESYRVASRCSIALSLCYHNNKLYDSGDDNTIRETLSGKELTLPTEEGPVILPPGALAMYSNDNRLYTIRSCEIIDVLSGKIIQRDVYLSIPTPHKGDLYGVQYMVNGKSRILNFLSGEVIAEREKSVNTLCSHNGTLFDAGEHPYIYDTFKGETITRLKGEEKVMNLCSHNGTLLAAVSGELGIIDVETRGGILGDYDEPIFPMSHMASVPYNLAQELIKNT